VKFRESFSSFEPNTDSDTRLRGSDHRWPVLDSLVSLLKGLVTLSRESEREREGGREVCL
jgi:hypothetical protein